MSFLEVKQVIECIFNRKISFADCRGSEETDNMIDLCDNYYETLLLF